MHEPQGCSFIHMRKITYVCVITITRDTFTLKIKGKIVVQMLWCTVGARTPDVGLFVHLMYAHLTHDLKTICILDSLIVALGGFDCGNKF